MGNKWTTSNEYAELNRFKTVAKKHYLEYDACMRNLTRLVSALDSYGELAHIKFGFLRPEGGGVWRIGQTGVPHAAETRLYIYFYINGKTVYQLTMGDKKQQPDDLRRCAQIVEKIKEKVIQ